MSASPAGGSASGPEEGGWLERWVFHHRPWVILLCVAVSVILLREAVQIRPATSFEKMIPTGHPFIRNLLAHRDDLESLGNSVRVAVESTTGDIFSASYQHTLRQLTDEAFYLPGVDRAALKSLWTANVRWSEVTEEGFAGGAVIPVDYDGSPASLAALRVNVLRSGQVGRLVANDFRSSIVEIPLQETYPDPTQPGRLRALDYQALATQMESRLRERFETQDPQVKVHIVGFAKKVGDLIDGLDQVLWFFLLTVCISLVALYLFTRCLRSSLAVLATTLVAVGWQLGLMHLAGFGLDPYSMLVPFLIFAIGVSHGVQKVNGIALHRAASGDALSAARLAFRQLFGPGMVAILADAVGFLTLLLIDIGVIRELAWGAAIGVAVIVFTNLILLPVVISYSGISRRALQRSQREAAREQGGWRWLAQCAGPRWAPWSLAAACLALLGGLWYGQRLQVGDLDAGAPELRVQSRYNQDNRFILEHYLSRSDVLVIMARSAPQQCASYATLQALDDLAFTLEALPGVQSTVSLASVAKLANKGMNEGNLKWQALSRNPQVLNSAVAGAADLYNGDCSLTPLLVFLDDHKATTLARVVAASTQFAAIHDSAHLQFLLAAGNAGIEAATNQVIAAAELPVLALVYLCVALMCLWMFRSLAATLCIVLPLVLTSVLANALMAFMGIGVKVATLPVVALGVGIGVDYGIYLYSRLRHFLDAGLVLEEAYYQALRSTGRAVLFTGICLALGVASWMFSPIKFQADMGLMLTFMLLWNMLGALWLMPALVRYCAASRATSARDLPEERKGRVQ